MQVISCETVEVNGSAIGILENVTLLDGSPKKEVKTVRVGCSVKPVVHKDYTEALGKVSFEIPNTKENRELYNEWKAGANTIRVHDQEADWSEAFKDMYIAEDKEVNFKDAKIEIEFVGGQGR